MSSTAPIAVYGAAGYTGRLVVAELVRKGITPILVGRGADRLRSVAERLAPGAEVRAAALDDGPALRAAIGDARAVIHCAGPFLRYGEPLLRAAIDTRVPYLDITGEQPYIRRVFEQYDAPARQAGIPVMPAAGMDYIPGDLLCHHLAQGLEPLAEIKVGYALHGFVPSRGSIRSALEIARIGETVYERGRWQDAPTIGPLRDRFQFPPPHGTQPVIRAFFGEVITVPRHVRVQRVTARAAHGTRMPAPLAALALPAAGLIMQTPARRLLDRLIDRLPDGPPEHSRTHCDAVIAAHATSEHGVTRSGVIRVRDVYAITANIVAHAAVLLTRPDQHATGALAPGQIFDPGAFLDAMHDHGLTWDTTQAPAASQNGQR